ncbi:hypothetical protein CAFE_28730 [Caprobacter fermentans]|uniref:DUF1648 domain-containing protein n=1 Tax=Caproicibacter fermentans TaxID=2576756 RepID=A0A6N8I204_9FIRM|nr:DUF1648 domain-containing protein [Caproicibacter fermentans]MVB12141.1 hypothetical protein [Caproicibacter fermentans]OCN01206.1 hypothetical protein A7X67_07500 [Clostridium sp. W14A]
MQRPKLKLRYGLLDKLLQFFSFLAVIGLIALTVSALPVLPATIPTHFGANGNPDGWGGKGSLKLWGGSEFLTG